MPAGSISKTKRDVTILVEDATTPTANSYTFSFENADLSIDFPQEDIILTLDRGVITDPPDLRWGDDQPITGSFSGVLRGLDDTSGATAASLLLNDGNVGTSWASTSGSDAEVFTVDMTITIEGTDHGESADHTIKLEHVHLTGSISDGDPMQWSINFTAYQLRPGTFE